MKVAYDISVLGTGYYYPRARTGIFRVAENLAYGLAASDECELSFCASESFQKLDESLDYLKSNLKLQEIQIFLPEFMEIRSYLNKRLGELNNEITSRTQPQAKLLPLRILRKALYQTSRILESRSHLINPKYMADIDIFHSPFYAIPKQIEQTKSIKKFLTIYDLIPILHPKFFEFNEDHLLNSILGSLNSEDWILCISQATKDDLCNYSNRINPSQVLVTHLAASELFYPCSNLQQIATTRNKYKIPPDGHYILSLCTLEPRKNIDHTIRCFSKLIQEKHLQDLYLVLVGTEGWDYHKIFDEISSHEALKNKIITTGYVADEDLAALYSGALMFVYPSFYEGFGLPPLEAMQCGIPVITSNTSSLPEVVGDAGIMVSPTDADALCQSMLEIYQDPSLKQKMSLRSLERAQQFSWQKCTRQTIKAYKTALST